MCKMDAKTSDGGAAILDGKFTSVSRPRRSSTSGTSCHEVGSPLSSDENNNHSNSGHVHQPPHTATRSQQLNNDAQLLSAAGLYHYQSSYLSRPSIASSSNSQSLLLGTSHRDSYSQGFLLESNLQQQSFSWYQTVAIFVSFFVPLMGIPACLLYRRAKSFHKAGNKQQTRRYLTASLAFSTVGLLFGAAAIFACFQLGIPSYRMPLAPATPAPLDISRFMDEATWHSNLNYMNAYNQQNDTDLSAIVQQDASSLPDLDMDKIRKFLSSFLQEQNQTLSVSESQVQQHTDQRDTSNGVGALQSGRAVVVPLDSVLFGDSNESNDAVIQDPILHDPATAGFQLSELLKLIASGLQTVPPP